ncbi:MAG: oxidoreductase [Pseudomonadota bacterium]
MSLDLQLTDKRVLVTGGTKGVGAATVEALVHEGARVIVAARSKPALALDGVIYVTADVSAEEGTGVISQAVLEHFVGVDILINVVGGSSSPSGGFAALDDMCWLIELNDNLMSAVRLDRLLLPSMLDQRSGVIVHVTSIQRILPLPESTIAYAAAKAALSTYSKALSKEVTPKCQRPLILTPHIASSKKVTLNSCRLQIPNCLISGPSVGFSMALITS